nr:hypothetical protein GCM10020093_058420 [Planobispora longispora]
MQRVGAGRAVVQQRVGVRLQHERLGEQGEDPRALGGELGGAGQVEGVGRLADVDGLVAHPGEDLPAEPVVARSLARRSAWTR